MSCSHSRRTQAMFCLVGSLALAGGAAEAAAQEAGLFSSEAGGAVGAGGADGGAGR